jgi:branched-subunit amino acid aminotransferase/4-amino-4-deoxychorismate lyase
VKTNQTGCLKLGTNYLISVKAVEMAQSIHKEAGAALFLDDRPDLPIMTRSVTEWDSSCCLFALEDGTIIKIPEGPLILPSVTIQGVCALASREGLRVVEREVPYGELVEWAQSGALVAICSIGTAGILNRCRSLHLRDDKEKTIFIHHAQMEHPIFHKLQNIKERYWNMFLGTEKIPAHIPTNVYTV